MEKFVKQLLQLVTLADKPQIRDEVMSLIASGTSPAIFPNIFNQLHATIKNYVPAGGQVALTPEGTLFVEQAISITRHILDTPVAQEDLNISDFEAIVNAFVTYISQMAQSPESLKIKTKLCTLLVTMMDKRELITFDHEVRFRNSLVERIMEWTSEFAFVREH